MRITEDIHVTDTVMPIKRRALRDLWRSKDAIMLIEFAYSLPVLIGLAFGSVEVTNLAIANMRVSQIAMTAADNVSRALQSVRLDPVVLREVDINDALIGAKVQGGDRLNILDNGRIILSSLQRDANNRQTIFWQRCKGMLNVSSAYGQQGATQGVTAGFTGMGAGSNKVQAAANSAIIFAEVTYDYEPIVGSWAAGNFRIRREAAYYVRDERRLDAIENPNPQAVVANCNIRNTTF
jgi:Flp pilus assembly protein TadG